MNRQQPVIMKRQVIGLLHIADWGVTFEPLDQRAAFLTVQLKTWETIEAARSEIERELARGVRRNG
jgi:hypothetical protein